MKKKVITMLLCATMSGAMLSGCTSTDSASESVTSGTSTSAQAADEATKQSIEDALNLANNEDQAWTYDSDADAWVLSITPYCTDQVLPDQQGCSVAVPGAYVTGIDTDGDSKEDVAAGDTSDAVNGALVIDYDAEVTSENGQIYTAATAPVILNTGAAGYSSQQNSLASTEYAADGYINVSCGNRGKQDSYEDEDGNTVYTGDAPDCLSDQKSCARFIRYNILLGNLPGSSEYLVSTGGSGGGAHAVMFAATGDSEDFYDYEIEEGAVGVYKTTDGSYTTTVTIDGSEYDLSDGAWGCIAYSAITPLAEADMDLAFEYFLDNDYSFNTDFQKSLAKYLSQEYMEYINDKQLSVDESAIGFDINEDGDTEDTVDLSIEYDEEAYADTNGYGGTYLTLYLDEFTENLQWYLDNLDYAEDWTWFDEDGSALSDDEVAAMTSEDKATAFIEGRYTESESSDMGAASPGEAPTGDTPSGDTPSGDAPSGDVPSGETPEDIESDSTEAVVSSSGEGSPDDSSTGNDMLVGTPEEGTSQSAGSTVDSENYTTFEEMLASYEEDIEEVEAGDEYGNNQVALLNPLNYIGTDGVSAPTWTRIVMGASEGDMSMFASLNMQIAWLNAGTNCEIEWQWNGGHVPSETLGNSFSLYVDEMYGEYVDGAVSVTKPEAEQQTVNGTATEATGTDISSWVDYEDISSVSVALSDAASYRTDGASKAMPGFDVIDYGQEDYVFGDSDTDARHWDTYVLQVFEDHADELEPLFNAGSTDSSTSDAESTSISNVESSSTSNTESGTSNTESSTSNLDSSMLSTESTDTQ